MGISSASFNFVSDFARRQAAIVIDPGKEYLVETRLAGLARDHAEGSLERFVELLRVEPASSALRARALDALTTNETSFFRDFHPYEALRKRILPDLIAAKGDGARLSIWSAACSAGQEPVSLALLLREHFPALADGRASILATDLSGSVLDQARAGRYTQFEVNRGLPAMLLAKHFKKHEDRWQVSESIRAMIEYRQRNLIEPLPSEERHDLVMLRNVLIYFDIPTKQQILAAIRQRMAPGGILVLGTAETTLHLDPAWEIVRAENSTVFRLKAEAR